MTSFEDDPELRAIFLQEAETRLDRVTDAAMELEADPEKADLVAQLFRDVHTLKGSAPLVGLHAVADVAHRLEDLLGDLRAGRRALAAGDTDAILRCADALRALIEAQFAGADIAPAMAAADAALALAGEARETNMAANAASPEPAAVTAGPIAHDGDETIPVSLARLDRLVRTAGEAIAAQLRLRELLGVQIGDDPDAHEATVALERSLGVLQNEALSTRMTTLATIAAPLRRAVRDVAKADGKEIEFAVTGDRVELDKAVLDGLRDPLLHLVRNAADHGVEPGPERAAAGKPLAGSVSVEAARRGGEVVISVRDDGRGLDLDALRAKAGEPELDDAAAAQLVFRAGLSTAKAVTDVSGRGVGMDAVRASVEAMRGSVTVHSERGRGTTFVLTAPLTLAVVPCLLVAAAGQRYAIPAHATATIVDDPRAAEVGLEGGAALWVGADVVPLTGLATVLGFAGSESGPAVVLQSATTRCALRVDAVLGQRDVTVKELGGVLPRSELVAGASVEADGAVVLVLDAAALADRAAGRRRAPGGDSPPEAPAPARRASVLVVDDAVTIRELQRAMLARAGYDVRTATDGRDALTRLAEERPDLLVTDVEMPELDGYALTEAIRADARLASLPVLMVTSRDSPEDRQRGLDAGADAYLVKQDFDEAGLLAAVRRLLGEAE